MLWDQGYREQEIAERVGVDVTTVERTRQKFVSLGLKAALEEQSRCGRSHKLGRKAEAYLVATACSQAAQGREEWTMQLLAVRLVALKLVESISAQAVPQVFKKTSLSRG